MSDAGAERATVDTTVIVSAFIARRGFPADVLRLWRERVYTLVVSRDLVDEYADVLSRPKLVQAYRIDAEERADFLEELGRHAEFVAPLSEAELPVGSRDPKDNLLLACALAGGCDYLVTGDNDLLALAGHRALGALRIVTPRAFVETLIGGRRLQRIARTPLAPG